MVIGRPERTAPTDMDLVRAKASLSAEYIVLDAVDIYGGNMIAAP